MNSKIWILIGLLSIALPSIGQWSEGFDQKPIEDTHYRGSSGEFGAMLLVTNDPEDFFEQWSRPPAEGYAPTISTVDTARRGDTVTAVILFSQCQPNDKGNCDSSIDYKLIDPAGGTYGDFQNAELWRDKVAPPKGSLQVGVDYMAFRVEPDDALGPYTFIVTVRDSIGKSKIELTQTIMIIEGKENDI